MIITFKTRGKENGKYIRHGFVTDGELEFSLCAPRVALETKSSSTMFMSKAGVKMPAEDIGKDCRICMAVAKSLAAKGEAKLNYSPQKTMV